MGVNVKRRGVNTYLVNETSKNKTVTVSSGLGNVEIWREVFGPSNEKNKNRQMRKIKTKTSAQKFSSSPVAVLPPRVPFNRAFALTFASVRVGTASALFGRGGICFEEVAFPTHGGLATFSEHGGRRGDVKPVCPAAGVVLSSLVMEAAAMSSRSNLASAREDIGAEAAGLFVSRPAEEIIAQLTPNPKHASTEESPLLSASGRGNNTNNSMSVGGNDNSTDRVTTTSVGGNDNSTDRVTTTSVGNDTNDSTDRVATTSVGNDTNDSTDVVTTSVSLYGEQYDVASRRYNITIISRSDESRSWAKGFPPELDVARML